MRDVPLMSNLALYRHGSRSAVIDPETALWAARMLYGEGYTGGKGAAVLWATMNAFMYRRYDYGTYLNYIREFSQPINPGWLPGGWEYKAAKRKGWKQPTSSAAVRRRRFIHRLQWADMSPRLRNLVEQFAAGALPYPPKFLELAPNKQRVSNFASLNGLKKKYPWGVGYPSRGRTEWFFQDRGLLPGTMQVIDGAGGIWEDPPSKKKSLIS